MSSSATPSDLPGPTERRRFLRDAVAAAAALPGAVPSVLAAQPPRAAAPGQPPLLPRRVAGVRQARAPWREPEALWHNMALRLARRTGYGLTAEEAARARRLGFMGYLSYQLAYEQIDDSACEEYVARTYPTLAMAGPDLALQNGGVVQTELQDAALYRAAFSKRQLYQRMVEFWSDHFTIYYPEVGYLKVLDDREVIRRHALGKFGDLLKASARSAAMLVYLDQSVSRRGAPNQNYARELLELHTVGVDGGYTQQDVAELARILTGWTVRGRGEFTFNPGLHDYAQKTFLGKVYPAVDPRGYTNPDGVREGEEVLDLLAAHPSTATFIATKLLRFFVWYEPTPAMVERVAAAFRTSGGDIRTTVAACLHHTVLYQGPAKLKRPFHFVASALRALNPTVGTGVRTATRQLAALGQPLFLWLTPEGYPDAVEFWAGNVLPRWNAASVLAALGGAEMSVDVAPWQALRSADDAAAAIATALFGDERDPRLVASLADYLRPAPTDATRLRETLGLALSSAPFQWY
jgi:uncharacterized protein (DUF1800 family)